MNDSPTPAEAIEEVCITGDGVSYILLGMVSMLEEIEILEDGPQMELMAEVEEIMQDSLDCLLEALERMQLLSKMLKNEVN